MTEQTVFRAPWKSRPGRAAAYLDEACADDRLRQRSRRCCSPRRPATSWKTGRRQIAAAPSRPGRNAALDADGADAAPNRLRPADACRATTNTTPRLPAAVHPPGSLGRLGHYEVLEVLGRGGIGIVLKAFDERLHRVVAIKVLARNWPPAPRPASGSSARPGPPPPSATRTSSPSTPSRSSRCPTWSWSTSPARPCSRSSTGPGRSTPRRSCASASRSPRGWRRPTPGAGSPRHQAGQHPAGERRRRVKITDFGLARAADDASLTQSGVIAGTPLYMSPEQARGEAIDHRTDLFSLGSVLYAMCSGRPPFRAATTLAVLKRVAEDTPRPIREINPEVARMAVRDHRQAAGQEAGGALRFGERSGRLWLAEPHGQGVPSPPDLVPKAERPRRGERKPRAAFGFVLGGGGGPDCVSRLLVAFLPAYWLRPSHGGPPADPKAPVVFRVEANQPWQDTGRGRRRRRDRRSVPAGNLAQGRAAKLLGRGTRRPWRTGGPSRSAVVVPVDPHQQLAGADGGAGSVDVFKPKHGGRLFVQANDLDLADDGDGLPLTITGGLHSGDAAPPPGPTLIQGADRDWKTLLAQGRGAWGRGQSRCGRR